MNNKYNFSRNCKILLCYVFILQSFQSVVAQAVVFEIGEIPPQSVWVSENQETTLDFQLKATGLGVTPIFSMSDDGSAQGQFSLDENTGEFKYVPHFDDLDPFKLTFFAEQGGQSISQDVTVTPLQELQAEQTAFGLHPGNPLPAPEDRRYLSVTESKGSNTEFFNTTNRVLRSVVIVGQTVVFEQDHANGLWAYHDNKDIKSLVIHADTVIFRSALRLPQTDVTIYARNLRFEDSDVQTTASLSTVPDAITTRPAQFQHGISGHQAGDITLMVDNVFTDESPNKRLILKGGNGQPAGVGKNGAKGRSNTSNVKRIDGTKWVFCSQRYWTFSGTIVTYATLTTSCSIGGTATTTAGNSKEPKSGTDATAGGKPGNGGSAGQLVSSLEAFAINVDNTGGIAGDRAPTAFGGAPGTPRNSREVACTRDKCTSTYTSTSYGRSYVGPSASIPVGQQTAPKYIGKTYRWMTPENLGQLIHYIKDVYLYGHYTKANELAEIYIDALDAYLTSDEWSLLDDGWPAEDAQALLQRRQNELLLAREELMALQQQLQANLDYFGNPVGWSPLLSFEVNRTAFEREIDVAMDVLWLNYWMSNGANSIDARRTTAKDTVGTLKIQIDEYKLQYGTAVDSIPRLQNEIENLAVDIDLQKQKIKQLEDELLPKAKNAALIRSFGRTLNKIAEVFPVTQPVLNFVGNFVSGIPDIDPDKPLEDELLNTAGNSAGAALDDYWNEGIDGQLEDTEALLECAEQSGPLVKACVAMEGVQRLNELRKPVVEELGATVKIIAGSSVTDPAVREELNRILAEDERYREIIGEIKALNQRKAEFAAELFSTIQKINFFASAITKNMLAIDAMNEVINDTTAALNPRVIGYLNDMAQRARHRLQLYQYYMVRAYEYRLLKPFTKELDLNRLFDDFCRLAIAVDENDLKKGLSGDSCDNNTARNLSKQDFTSLKGIFEDQLADIAFEILDEYNNNPSSELTGGITFNVPAEILQKLNDEGAATLNLVDDLRLFSLREENLRLLEIKVQDVQFDNLNNGNLNYMDICFVHSGISKLRKNGETWLFRHYNDRASGLIEWRNRYDDGNISLLPLSAASNSLLGSLIGNDNPNLLLYSRPGAWADLTLTSESTGSAITRITSMKVVVKYDFTNQPFNLKTLKLIKGLDGIESFIKLQQIDKTGRHDGRGEFLRSFVHGEDVTLEAPEKVGNYQFERWIGSKNSTNNIVTVKMDRNYTLLPVYRQELDEDEDGVADSEDNCLNQKNPAQIDSDNDGYGNACDADLNNDGIVNTLDLGAFRKVFGSNDADADFNGDGIVNTLDLGRMRNLFGKVPGPSAVQ